MGNYRVSSTSLDNFVRDLLTLTLPMLPYLVRTAGRCGTARCQKQLLGSVGGAELTTRSMKTIDLSHTRTGKIQEGGAMGIINFSIQEIRKENCS